MRSTEQASACGTAASRRECFWRNSKPLGISWRKCQPKPAPLARARSILMQIKFGGVCLKKLELISNRTLTDFARAGRVVALNCIVRSDCVVMRTNAPRPHSRTRAGKIQKFSLPFFFSSAGGVGGADKKWKGNFWFCFAVSVCKKSNYIIAFLFALFFALTATEAQYNLVCARAQSYLICACPTRPVRAQQPPPFLGNIIKRRGLLPYRSIISL